MKDQDTIFALSSGRPPAAVAVIRISGPAARDAARIVAGGVPEIRRASLRELRDPRSGEILDRALVLRFDSPDTATGEDVVEFQCHGGRAIVDAVLGALGSIQGLRLAEPGEFTRRAFEFGRIDLTEAEGLADLLEAETESQRKAALALAEGGLRATVEKWQDRLLALAAEAERAIDYDEEHDATEGVLSPGCADLAKELESWLDRPRAERLKDGIRVAVVGPPNAGKSSLFNMIVGDERAIVADVPGTTRDLIEAPLSIGGVPVLLIDSAGLRESSDPVEAIGVERAGQLVRAADVLLWLGEPESGPAHERTIFVHSKADVPGRDAVPEDSIPVSVLTGSGIAELTESIQRAARSLLPAEGAIALNRRQAAHLECAAEALRRAAATIDPLLAAEELRSARTEFDRITGRAGFEDLLDALFGRFCLGK